MSNDHELKQWDNPNCQLDVPVRTGGYGTHVFMDIHTELEIIGVSIEINNGTLRALVYPLGQEEPTIVDIGEVKDINAACAGIFK